MKTITIFQVQAINELLTKHHYDYFLKLHDTCGSQSLSLECNGEEADIDELCALINDYLKNDYLTVVKGQINPYNLNLK